MNKKEGIAIRGWNAVERDPIESTCARMSELNPSIEIPEKRRFQADRVPSRTTWPPPWLTEAESAKPECKVADIAVETLLAVGDRVDTPLAHPLPLSRVLPPLSWLTREQRHRFEQRASVYQYDGRLSREAAEQESLCELIFNGGIG